MIVLHNQEPDFTQRRGRHIRHHDQSLRSNSTEALFWINLEVYS